MGSNLLELAWRKAGCKQGTNGRWPESRMLKTEIPEVVSGNGKVSV